MAEKQNQLTVVKKNEFLSLSEDGGIKEALDAITETGAVIGPDDLVRVKTPAQGGTQWEIPVAGQIEHAEEITGALVMYQQHGVLWPSFDPVEGQPPVLRTFDLITADLVGDIPEEMEAELERCKIEDGKYDWLKLSYNQWGSGKDGIGKRCTEQRMMFILRPQDAFPLLVTIQPGSLRDVDRWFKQAAFLRVPWWRLVVQLRLKQAKSKGGITFSKVVPKVVGQVDEETGALLKKTWTDNLRQISRQVAAEADTEQVDE